MFKPTSDALTAQRGRNIAFARLGVCWSTVFAQAPFASIPPSVPGALRRAYSSAWSIALCEPGVADAQLNIGLPDAPSDLPLDGDSIRISSLRVYGGGVDFVASGLNPQLFEFGTALTPEEAVRATFLATKRQITEVPKAVIYFGEEAQAFVLPLCAAWRIQLDSPIRVRGIGTRSERDVAELYVRRSPNCVSRSIEFFTPREPLKTAYWILVPRDTTLTVDSLFNVRDSVALQLNAPLALQQVEIVR